MNHTIRMVNADDVPALHQIYAQYVNTDISFEYSLPSLDVYRSRIETIHDAFPFLVLEQEGKPIGFAYAQRVRARDAYQWSAELSIYLDKSAAAHGLGSRLYLALIALLKVQGVCTIYGAITSSNETSLRFHEKLDFQYFATFKNVGYKNGHWLDVHWVQKEIAPYDAPNPVIKFSEMDTALIKEVLRQANEKSN